MANRFSLDGATALVTGAGRGIGRALAAGLAEAGARVVASGRAAADLEATVGDLPPVPGGHRTLILDVADAASIEAGFAALEADGWSPDLLVANAGIEEVRPSLDVDEALWHRIVDTNLKGAFFVARRFAAPLVAAGRPGAIVTLCSLTSELGVPTAVPYTASKAGLLGMTRALAAEWAPHRIRVNGIGPGYFRTGLTEPFFASPDWQERMLAKIPLGRFGALDDLVGATVFLCSGAAAYVTGQLLYVDGGTTAAL